MLKFEIDTYDTSIIKESVKFIESAKFKEFWKFWQDRNKEDALCWPLKMSPIEWVENFTIWQTTKL